MKRGILRKYMEAENQRFALKDVNLSIDRGEFISIVGTSGSGKSTLLHLLEVWMNQHPDRS